MISDYFKEVERRIEETRIIGERDIEGCYIDTDQRRLH